MLDSGSPMQCGCTGSFQAPGRIQMYKAGGSTDEAPQTITILWFLSPKNGHFWTVATIYHNLQKIMLGLSNSLLLFIKTDKLLKFNLYIRKIIFQK